MKRINIIDAGIIPDGCVSERLTQLIADSGDDVELYFPSGSYYISKPVAIENRRGLTLVGDNATIVTHFTPDGDPKENNNGFNCRDCRGLTFTGFTCTTDNPLGAEGRVVAVDNSAHTYDVKIDDKYQVTGWEHFWGTDTFDEDGTPDYVIETYDKIVTETLTGDDGKPRQKFTGTRYEVIGDHMIRVYMPEYFDLSRLNIGHRVHYRYLIYGNTLFSFADCHDVTLRDIEIERCASMGAVISPRSSNFVFDNFNIRPREGSGELYAANADGIHIVGLAGSLIMKNCKFAQLGDDALNIHNQAGEISAIARDGGQTKIDIISRLNLGGESKVRELVYGFAAAGDKFRVYEKDSFIKKGGFEVVSYESGHAVIENIEGSVEVGDIIANETFFASVQIENCEVRNTRARGFLLQSENMTIRDCRFFGMSLPGLLIAPDVIVWYEVGPSTNTLISGCEFEKCAVVSNDAAIMVRAAHDGRGEGYPAGVHRNLTIKGNSFSECGGSAICVSSTDNVAIIGNRFDSGDTDRNIRLINCANIVRSDANTD